MNEDYEAIAAVLATTFEQGSKHYCRYRLEGLRPLVAARLAVSVYAIFITSDKELARSWDAFLRDNT